MRIAFLHRNVPPDTYTGVAVQVHRLANALEDLGHQVDLFTWTPNPSGAKYRVITMPHSGLASMGMRWPLVKRLWHAWQFRKLDLKSYDAVHVHGDGGLLRYSNHWVRTLYGSAAFERRYGFGWSSWIAQTLSFALERREARSCRHLIAIGTHVKKAIPQVKAVLPCMLDASPVQELSQTSDIPTLIHVGSLRGRKRGHLALDILRHLHAWRNDFRLHLVCPPKEAKSLRESLSDARVEVHTQITREKLNALYRESWFALSLSTYEGFGVTLIEAMAQGCQVLSVPHAGALDLFEEEWPEILCEIKAMPERIKTLAPQGKPDSQAAKRAKQYAARFAPGLIAQAYVDLYRSTSEGRRT